MNLSYTIMLMKFFLLLLGVCSFSSSLSQLTDCQCAQTTEVKSQHRSGAKHSEISADFVRKKKIVDVSYLYGWEKKYSKATKGIKRNPKSPLSKRVSHTPEDTLYTLRGYMWFVKQEDNDCDLHIEIGAKDGRKTRIIIEVTAENDVLQAKIKRHLDSLGLSIMNCNCSNSDKCHFKKGIQVLVAGLGFYDASHKPNTNHGDAHTKKYSWELHPVADITFL